MKGVAAVDVLLQMHDEALINQFQGLDQSSMLVDTEVGCESHWVIPQR